MLDSSINDKELEIKISPTNSIRKHCLTCMCGQSNEVKACPTLKCDLWKFRLGIHPFTKKNRSNRFLQAKEFEGLQNRSASEVIQIIKSRNKLESKENLE